MSRRRAALAYLAARLREPSSWAALAVLASVAGMHLPPELVGAAPELVGLVAALLGVALPERRP